MKSRKWFALVAAAALTLGVAGPALAAPTVPGLVYTDGHAAGKPPEKVKEDLEKAGVKDVKADDWFAGSITVVVEAGLLKPDANGMLNPTGSVTASEGIAVFAKVLGIASKNDTPEQATQKAMEAGLISGPVAADRDMSRVEVARLLAKALGVEPKLVLSPAQYPFNDFEAAAAEDRGILAALYELGVFKGYEDRTFRPDTVLTKAQIAILIDRILGAFAM